MSKAQAIALAIVVGLAVLLLWPSLPGYKAPSPAIDQRVVLDQGYRDSSVNYGPDRTQPGLPPN